MKRICVFCGSSPGAKPEYSEAALELGHALADQNIGLVYGGGNVGLMGRIARAVLEKGGNVTGVIPKALADKEVAFTDLDDLRVVGSMHERKALMAELSDGFIALPGGLGTIEEFVEVLTWAQLGIHQKPCGLLNVCQYYKKFSEFIDHVAGQNFIGKRHRELVLIDDSPESLLEKFASYRPPDIDKAAWALRMKNS
ncbi:cytokinin riboside 5'-monophosphate phosphoribohydrolase [Desulfosarcina widdelii]|uniref:Cytokinin riboside 5'-monophosphate phosphoribohydrolase n=1 Tax=Desulfosarcina widdelii TaxID=947919 RepID=A0A5K7Z0W9_9BACT|nr:TIGR00730 family Rossman fold protein [Desulfosarcina widdelii]BBO75622.1 cytokinin riboside 5'-monophosphate phosphoribohydrolase [Desulfosarcina widdelii]